MSFAATLALVAAYERGLPWASGGADSSFGARVALWGGREIAALIFASLVAGFATTPYAAFHFHRVAPYGVIANLMAMPIVSVLVMPAGLAALVAMPFGLDGPLWRLMGLGIDWMTAVALWVTSLPGAVGRVTAFGVGALLVITAGIAVLCLLRSRLRYAGVAIILVGCGLAVAASRSDVLISSGGEAVAVRTASGKLSVLKFGGSAFTIVDWLGGDADTRKPDDKTLGEGFACDENGCVARLADNTVIAVARAAAALACKAASLVITPRDAPPGCAAKIIDRKMLRARGAMDLRRAGGSWQIEAATPPGTDQPWARGVTAEETPATTTRPASRAPARDATPRAEDLEADD
jgi:competence protein ComEC